ncbi:MAG: MBL fold metallo-hydrolase [Candidatus Hydrogenedentes bacterium]|nr:MBL fold metallo-hydrolase [Candidatus Hydrogenedentota bacterium]
MIRFTMLSAGSGGNAILIATDTARILIDSGVSFKQLTARAAAVGESIEGLDAVFVTHEHRDHVLGLGTLARKLGVPVYMTPGTRDCLPGSVGRLPRVEVFEAGEAVQVDGAVVRSFSVSHDAADPVSYVVEAGGAKLGLAADLGHPSHLVRSRLAGCHGLILESNHCPDMLRRGSYPPMVQQRIRGRQGHLSNDAMSALLAALVHDALQVVVLTHISEENNTHELAYDTAAQVVAGRPVEVHVAWQDRPTRIFEIRA